MIFIYLDFDGVLNNETARELDQLFHFDQAYFLNGEDVPATVYHAMRKLSVANVMHFKRALYWLKDLEPRLVISSSWRKTMTMEEMQLMMDRIGIEPSWLHSFTAQTSEDMGLGFLDRRAFEIREHILYHGLNLNEIAVIDDARLFDLGAPEQERFIHVSCWTGFDADATHRLIKIFKPNWKEMIRC